MPSRLYRKFKRQLNGTDYIRVVIWEVDPSVLGSEHKFKYSFAYVASGVCVMRYDNERGKGDHKHIGDREISTDFVTIEQLLEDFINEVMALREGE
ncbi:MULTISPECIES: toxin-antitoxin system TumE family protein [Serratia]|uniref:Uncharacterized protein n=1 Tax=Serratia quinivorans TaxID=137545 RepID=A0A379YF70_9GAMM|nr:MULTISPECIES: DUF6516 family protein [Serratia]RYM66296.1 hypothetical protein BSR03_01580 [Serratia proteamaculans]CAI1830584.1 Uncharacterised protein [Serratia quinivorans]SUI44180.1 Uncharacterised protein [Serratia quinivorans]